MVVNYQSDNREYYSQSVQQHVASSDEYDADNEALDAYINAIVDTERRRALRWEKYPRQPSHGALGKTAFV